MSWIIKNRERYILFMKKRLLTSALILTLAAVMPVNAGNINVINNTKPSTNLKEIVLGENQNYDTTFNTALMATNTSGSEKNQPINLDLMNSNEERLIQDGIDNPTAQRQLEGSVPVMDLKGGVAATEAPTKAEIEKTVVKQWLDGDYATGKWFGARPLFEDHGLTVNSSLLYGPMVKTGGGANDEASGKGYSLFNLSVSLDTEKAKMWKGGTFYALYQKKTGYGISGANGDNGAMGDWMGLDGWDWRQINQISEYWYQQKFFNDKVRLKVGKQDSNNDFGFLNSGWDFMNTAFSVNPTTPMPTYPDQAFGFMAEINPKEWLSIRNGIYSNYNTPFNITEIEVKPMIKNLPGRYMLGAWEMSDSNGMGVATGIDSNEETIYNNFNRNFGAYVGFEQMVYKENKDNENDMQGLTVFGQAGMSPSNKNDMSKYVGGGLHYIGPIPKRDKDRVGIAVASGNFTSRLANITSQVGSETAVELFYRAQITPWFYLQPDVQLIMNPSGIYGNSVAFGLRSVITF